MAAPMAITPFFCYSIPNRTGHFSWSTFQSNLYLLVRPFIHSDDAFIRPILRPSFPAKRSFPFSKETILNLDLGRPRQRRFMDRERYLRVPILRVETTTYELWTASESTDRYDSSPLFRFISVFFFFFHIFFDFTRSAEYHCDESAPQRFSQICGERYRVSAMKLTVSKIQGNVAAIANANVILLRS